MTWYRMESTLFVFLCFTNIITQAFATTTTLKYFNEKSTWSEAQKKCSENNGKLMIPDSANIQRFNESCSVAMNETIWVGQYRSLSKWIETVGCYDNWYNKSYINAQRTSDDPLLCQHLCQNSTHFGMNDGKCICIGSDILSSKALADPQNCNIECGGRNEVLCGGNNTISVYATVTRNILDEPDTNCTKVDCFCVSADCQTIGSTTQIAYFRRPCSDDLSTVCENNELVTGDAPNWAEAMSKCIDQQNSYPVTSSSNSSICDKVAITWTGMFRDIFVATDETGVPVTNIHDCQVVDLTVMPIRSKTHNCTEKMPFVCEIVLKPGESESLCISTTTIATTTTEDIQSTTLSTQKIITTTQTETTTTQQDTTTTQPETRTTTEGITTTEVQTESEGITTQKKYDTTKTLLLTNDDNANIGAIVGGVVASLLFLVLIIIIIFFICRRKRRHKFYSENEFTSFSTQSNIISDRKEILGFSNIVSDEMTELRVPSMAENETKEAGFTSFKQSDVENETEDTKQGSVTQANSSFIQSNGNKEEFTNENSEDENKQKNPDSLSTDKGDIIKNSEPKHSELPNDKRESLLLQNDENKITNNDPGQNDEDKIDMFPQDNESYVEPKPNEAETSTPESVEVSEDFSGPTSINEPTEEPNELKQEYVNSVEVSKDFSNATSINEPSEKPKGTINELKQESVNSFEVSKDFSNASIINGPTERPKSSIDGPKETPINVVRDSKKDLNEEPEKRKSVIHVTKIDIK